MSQQYALRRNLRHVLEWDDARAPNIVEDVKLHLALKRVVILDLSLITLDVAQRVAQIVLDGVFAFNVAGITRAKTISAVAVFEEAQNVLNKKAVEDGTSVFCRWAKEGRKFDLGLMYVTQQPGAIAEEIVSQTDNFFVMHLLCRGDIDALRKANPHYDGVIADFLGMETLVGNTYVYSAPAQPYVFPAKVAKFTPDFLAETVPNRNAGEAVGESPAHTPVAKGVLQQLAEIANAVKPAVGRKYQRWRTLVGACSREIYSYFKKNDIAVPFMSDDKGWIDYATAENLIRVLAGLKLLQLPESAQEIAAEPADAERANGR